MIVEGESLFNDGTAVVLFGILLEGVSTGHLNVATGVGRFVVVVLGAAALGAFLGFVFSKITQRIDDPRIEITLTTILAYSSYLTAQSLHLSGVIATVAAGIVLGNFGTRSGMSPRTQMSLWSFWEYAAFVINSLLFLLIGMQVHIGDLVRGWHAALLAIAAVLLGRTLSVYGLTPLSNLFSEGIPLRWQHVLVWGGLRGALALALALSLDSAFPYRADLLAWTFGVVAFSLVVQGFTVKPLLRCWGWPPPLRTSTTAPKFARSLYRPHARSSTSCWRAMRFRRRCTPGFGGNWIPVSERPKLKSQEMYTEDAARAHGEMRTARTRLLAAEKGAIQHAFYDGLISQQTAAKMIDAADHQMRELERQAGRRKGTR